MHPVGERQTQRRYGRNGNPIQQAGWITAPTVQAVIAYCDYVLRRYRRFPAYTAPFRTIIGFQVCRVDVEFYDRFYNPDALPDALRACTERALRNS